MVGAGVRLQRRPRGPRVLALGGRVSTIISLVLGTLLALALLRYKFFGRDVISLLVILPIALPGIVTGIALNNMFTTILGVSLSLWTVVIAHATSAW